MIKKVVYLVLIVSVVFLTTSFVKRKPKILIIGDSISIGYTPFVQHYFSDIAIVSHNPGNGQHTGNGLKKMDEWLGNEKWDIIQFNWGLWDLCYREPNSKVEGNRDKINGKVTYSVDEYSVNLDSLVTILQNKTNAKLIFVTTTYVPENEPGRFKSDVQKYNDAAKKIMKKHAIMVNDIHKKSIPIHKKFGLGSDNVHYTKEGYQKLSELINDCLKNQLVQ